MKSQDYKTVPSTVDLGAILQALSSRLERMESRLDAIEGQMVRSPFTPIAPRPPIAEPREQIHSPSLSSASISVSGSPAPASVLSLSRERLLAPVEEQMVNFIRSRTHVCAEDVRVHFRYKGSNAASSRLNRLFELGVLDKQQAGRRVYYRVR